MPEPIEQRLHRVRDAARRLGLGEASVWKLIAAGDLVAVRVGSGSTRIRESDLVAFINSRPTVQAAAQ